MARPAAMVNVFAAGLVALGASGLTAGCANNTGSRVVDRGVEYTIAVRNDSKRAVDVSWAVAFRRVDDGELGAGLERPLGVIEPDGTGRDGPMTVSMPADASASQYVQVLRVVVAIPSASWQDPARMWWEVVGPVPGTFVVAEGPGPDGFGVRLCAEGTTLEAVPRQFWPDHHAEQ